MDTLTLRQRIEHEEFDYQILLDALREYARPRDKISDLIEKGVIVRVKKGLYVFREAFRRRPASREILANLIYGPSYISLEYALHYYGLIPERVESLTSVAHGRSRTFDTPIGTFSYRGISGRAFRTGMDRVDLGNGRSFLIATPEKALADKIVEDRGSGIRTQTELQDYLLNDLRIDPTGLRELNPERLLEIAACYRSRRIKMLSRLVGNFRHTAQGD